MQKIKEFLMMNLTDFNDASFDFPIGLILTLTLILLCFSIFIITYRKRYTVAIIRSLIRHKAKNEESARTLKELRLAGNRGLERALSRSGQLTYMVKRVTSSTLSECNKELTAEEKKSSDDKIDFSTARFYLCEEHIDRANTLVEKTNTSWLTPGICSGVLLLILVLAFFFLEDLLLLIF